MTLADALRLALPPGTVVLAGEHALDRPITWARVLRGRPAVLASFERDELVLVATSALQHFGTAPALPRMVADLAEWGVAGFAFSGPVPPEVVAAARQVRVPLLALPEGASVTEVERDVGALVLDRAAQLGRRVQEVHDRLLALALEDGGIPPLVSLLAQVAGKTALVLDLYLQVQAFAPFGGDDPAELLGLLRARLAGVRPGQDLPSTLRAGPLRIGAPDRAVLVRPLLIRGTPAGLVCLVARRDAFDDFDAPLLERAATVLAIELAKQRAVAEVRLRHQGNLVDDLLEGHFGSDDEMLARARALGYDLALPRATIVLAADEAGLAPGRLAEVAHADLVARYPAALLRERGEQLTVLLPLDGAEDADRAVAAADELRSRLGRALEGVRLSAGVGRAHPGPSGYVLAHREAERALEIARGLLGGDRTAHFQQLGALRLIFELAGSAEPREFVRDHLGPLEERDARTHSDLVRTLEVFLEQNGNHVRAAQRLHLHRNTLLYRLDRIRSILGVDIEDADVRLTLGLALKIRSVLGARGALEARSARPRLAVAGAS